MDFLTQPITIAEWTAEVRRSGGSVGFVPTMGALHEGHLDLLHRAKAVHAKVGCSIFVNPLQFSDPNDLKHYPRQLERDRALLEKAGCDVLFAPEKEAIFADFRPTVYALGGLDAHWEGPSRPGHFQGVVNVVERLFHYVRPNEAFFGEKDRQQLALLRYIARSERWPERVTGCPTVRATDGLALSSRNARLNPEERKQAAVLHRALKAAAALAFREPVEKARQAGLDAIATEASVVVDYFGIADHETLEPLTTWGERDKAVALVAAQVGPVRLIDNVTLQR
ncbi:MAG: pantoate--beta-alanine ligase [Flavobacteriales bacterium]|nr:pantoate--beta-alanine ligase [Flavobacteriales bacterium]